MPFPLGPQSEGREPQYTDPPALLIQILRRLRRVTGLRSRRPRELAADQTPMVSVLQHALERLPADTLVLLQPTSPVRETGLVDRCIRQFQRSGADSLATGYLCKAQEYGKLDTQRQDFRGFFADDGSVYVIQAGLLRQGDRYGKKIERVILDREQNLDLDDEFDFWMAEQVLERRARMAGVLR